jgi:hypothetical protein
VTDLFEGVEVDGLFLANSAETPPNGLLYVLGGAWSRCWPPEGTDYPYERSMAIVVLLRVPWNDTNQQHTFVLRVHDDDDVELAKADGVLKAGRQPDLTDGASQVVVACLKPRVKLAKMGLYYVSVTVNGAHKKRIQFEAITNPAKPPVLPSAPAS